SRDEALRDERARHGVCFEPATGAEAAIADVHADRLAAIVEAHGWPGVRLVGARGAQSAWIVAMNATGRLALMRAWADRVERAAHEGGGERYYVARLMDRIRVLRGKEQVYATQFHRDPSGVIVPYPYARPDTIDDRRGSVQLDPLDETL